MSKNNNIVLSAGHGGKDPGAVGSNTTEAAIVTEFRDLVAWSIKQLNPNINVLEDGANGENLPLNDVIKLIKNNAPVLSIEFHCNASANAKASGVECLSQVKDKVLSQSISKLIATELGIKTRGDNGWVPENGGQHTRLAIVQNGGIIVELFFISNTSETNSYIAKKSMIAKKLAKLITEHVSTL